MARTAYGCIHVIVDHAEKTFSMDGPDEFLSPCSMSIAPPLRPDMIFGKDRRRSLTSQSEIFAGAAAKSE
jgi:hypothetical protein